MMKIPFNKPYLTGKELDYIRDAVDRGKISGNGYYTQKCQKFFQDRYGFKKCLLTTSCTDALEMAAILCDIRPGDEVIVPSYTFVSTANAFVLRGAKIIFADSREDHPGIDETKIESLINERTKVIVPVHYAGVACDMDLIMAIAEKHNLLVVEDSAQAIDSYYKGKPLGGIGHFGCFSFHETKNIQCGEGGMLVINDERFINRAEIIWEKGTNRAEFYRGEVNKYGWVDIGSSFLPSEITSAFLFAQLKSIDKIQQKRRQLWQHYYTGLKPLADKCILGLPYLPDYGSFNNHIFYIMCNSLEERTSLILHLKQHNILSVFHYLSLHRSSFFSQSTKSEGQIINLPFSDNYEDKLVRLPLFYELTKSSISYIIKVISSFDFTYSSRYYDVLNHE
jgi:dTDP-4-amino-4,6-dideoxygalactose transaminase